MFHPRPEAVTLMRRSDQSQVCLFCYLFQKDGPYRSWYRYQWEASFYQFCWQWALIWDIQLPHFLIFKWWDQAWVWPTDHQEQCHHEACIANSKFFCPFCSPNRQIYQGSADFSALRSYKFSLYSSNWNHYGFMKNLFTFIGCPLLRISYTYCLLLANWGLLWSGQWFRRKLEGLFQLLLTWSGSFIFSWQEWGSLWYWLSWARCQHNSWPNLERIDEHFSVINPLPIIVDHKNLPTAAHLGLTYDALECETDWYPSHFCPPFSITPKY